MLMDALSVVLRDIHLRGSVYFKECFQSPWGLSVASSKKAAFHIIDKGSCWLNIKGRDEQIKLLAGDAVILPHGTEHQLLDNPNSDCLPAVQVVEKIHKGENPFLGSDGQFNIVCGYFEFDRDSNHAFVDSLPELIHITQEYRHSYSWLNAAIKMLTSESANNNLGKEVLIERLTDVLFIQIIRCYIEHNKEQENFIAALNSGSLNKVLCLLHESPELNWTLASLAEVCNMSRSKFTARFKESVGVTPMKYLLARRMFKAKQLISQTQYSLTSISEMVGYQSESSFKSAFKQFFGKTPSNYRSKL